MAAFTLLWHSILKSSLWIEGSKETRLVWITLLAMKDSDGAVMCSMVGLADAAKVTAAECRKAIEVLSSPDPEDTSKVDEGRRIREVRGGWQIVNHDYYRFSTEAKREFWRQQKAEQRALKPKNKMSLRQKINKAVDSDEITKADQKELRRLRNGKPSKAEREYDQDFEGDASPEDSKAGGGRPGDDHGPGDVPSEGLGLSGAGEAAETATVNPI